MSICTNCQRDTQLGCYAGPFFFCSFLCRDTSKDLRDYQEHMKEFPWPQPDCGVPNCQVCSGAMRERKGDANG